MTVPEPLARLSEGWCPNPGHGRLQADWCPACDAWWRTTQWPGLGVELVCSVTYWAVDRTLTWNQIIDPAAAAADVRGPSATISAHVADAHKTAADAGPKAASP